MNFLKIEHNFDQGVNSVTNLYQDEDGNLMVGKTKRNNIGLERSYQKQAESWNKFYKGTKYHGAIVVDDEDGEALYVPFIKGTYPNPKQHLNCLKEMLENGYVMRDCDFKKNFIVNENKVFPVDFGLIYSRDENCIHYNLTKSIAEKTIQQLEQRLEKQLKQDNYKQITYSNNKQEYANFLCT